MSGQPRPVFSALLWIIASQIVLAGLLFGTVAMDRPTPLPIRDRLRKRHGVPPIVQMRRHQRRLSSREAARQRSLESAHR